MSIWIYLGIQISRWLRLDAELFVQQFDTDIMFS